MNNSLIVKPLNKDNFHFKQSKYNHLPKIPMRGIFLGPSGTGKTNMLGNMIINMYNGCFERIYIWSPSIGIDSTYQHIMDYQSKNMETEDDKLYFNQYNEFELEKIIEMQRKVIEYQKSQNMNKLFSICIIIDDFADDTKFSRNSHMLHSLFTRGRHFGISTIVLTQKFNALAPIIRINASFLIVFKLRNQQELDTLLNENSALVDKNTMLKIYKKATDEKYNFLYIDLMAGHVNDMFYYNFTQKFKL